MRFKKVLAIALAGVLGLLAIVLGAAALVIARPSLVLNDRTLEWGGRFLRAHGQDIRWKTAHISVESPSFLQKKVSLRFDGACVNLINGLVAGCVDDLELGARANLKGLIHPEITDVDRLIIRGGNLAINLDANPPSKPEAKKPESKDPDILPSFLAGALVHELEIGLDRAQIAGFDGDLALKIHGAPEGSQVDLRARALAPAASPASASSAKKRDELSANLALRRAGDLRAESLVEVPGWKLELAAADRFASGARAEVKGTADPEGEALNYRLAADYADRKAKGPHIQAHVEGDIRQTALHAKLDAEAASLIPEIPTSRLENCRISLEAGAHRSVESERGHGGHLSLDCPLAVSPRMAGIPPDLVKHLPTEVRATFRTDLDTASFPPSPSEPVTGQFQLALVPVEMPLFHASGDVTSTVNGIPTRALELHHDTDVAITLSVPKFADLVKALKDTRYAVWAPVSALDGQVDVAVKGRVDTNRGTLPFKVTTRLASPQQKLDLDADGQLAVSGFRQGAPKTHASITLVLSDVQLEMPRLDLKAPPRLLPDSRITSTAPDRGPPPGEVAPAPKPKIVPITPPGVSPRQAAGVAPPTFSYDVELRTPDGHPIRILTNLAEKPIPIGLDLKLASDAPLGGTIAVRDFPVEFFRRKATVDHFTLNLADPSSDSRVDGAVRMNYADYVVTLLIVGTIDKPQIQLVSDPPLDQDEIVSVLLYGRTMDELDPDQTSSVGSTQAAVADRALGLLSLYALASTPIQSVGYDPGTGEVLVKVRLSEGTSLNLGTQPGGTQDIGIRRNLSRHWSISTDLNPPSAATGNRNVVSAFLEWGARY